MVDFVQMDHNTDLRNFEVINEALLCVTLDEKE
jgi:hypothetical protein